MTDKEIEFELSKFRDTFIAYGTQWTFLSIVLDYIQTLKDSIQTIEQSTAYTILKDIDDFLPQDDYCRIVLWLENKAKVYGINLKE